MRKLLLTGCLMLVAFASTATQSSVTGHWRAVLLIPDGGTQNLSIDLDARGEIVTGTLLGQAIREGRIDGSTLTLKATAPNGREAVLTGQVSGDEIVFTTTGLLPAPIHFVARRDAVVTGRISDAAVVQSLMKQFGVPGVSIAIIKDFKVERRTSMALPMPRPALR